MARGGKGQIAIAAIGLVLLLQGACSSPSRETTLRSIRFVDSAIFDDQLSASLAAQHDQVTVRFEGDEVSVNGLPPRFDAWLVYVARKAGGTVELRPDPELAAARGVETLALSLVMGAYQAVQRSMLYRPARGYDIAVYHEPGGTRITRAVFVRKTEAAAGEREQE